jgi:predicted lipoprotein with Yx(FWY)xxD motif
MRQIFKFLLPTLAASVLVAACGSSSSSSSAPASSSSSHASTAAVVVKTASNPTVHATVLVNSQGMTLYHLTAEANGKWVCTTSACTSVWHPLTVSSKTPSGSVGSLSAVNRPDGALQVTYKGEPLYTFAQDTKPGDAKGQGFKDVGTWMAVTTGAAASSTPAPATSTSSTSPSGY